MYYYVSVIPSQASWFFLDMMIMWYSAWKQSSSDIKTNTLTVPFFHISYGETSTAQGLSPFNREASALIKPQNPPPQVTEWDLSQHVQCVQIEMFRNKRI